MRDIIQWTIRRSPGHNKIFQIMSFDEESNSFVIAEEFNNIDDAQEFAKEANRMIMRTANKN